MVTDEEYKKLVNRVLDLEKKYHELSVRFNNLYMKADMNQMKQFPGEEHRDQRRKDITKYIFNGEKWNKRQLVLECIKAYIQERNIDTIEDLKVAFPDYVQGSLGIVKRANEAERYSNAAKRFFFKDADIIHLKDGDYVVCSQWDAKNIPAFIKLAEDLGMKIVLEERKYR